jgi:uncharacterized membrane protein
MNAEDSLHAHALRVDFFIDAAFAFTVTLLVIANSDVPHNLDELLAAVRGIPAFAAAFTQIVLFWRAHLRWRRDFGVVDAGAFWLSLLLVFLVLVFVYPLEMMYSSAFHFLTAGWLPSRWVMHDMHDLKALFVCYGIVFALLSGATALLFLHSARKLEGQLARRALVPATTWLFSCAIGLLVALVAALLPANLSGLSGFLLALLSLQGLLAKRVQRRLDRDAAA